MVRTRADSVRKVDDPLLAVVRAQRCSAPPELLRVERRETRNGLQQRRLARSVGPDQPHALTFADREADSVQDLPPRETYAERFHLEEYERLGRRSARVGGGDLACAHVPMKIAGQVAGAIAQMT